MMFIKTTLSLFALSFLLVQVPREVKGMKTLELQETSASGASIKGRVFRSDNDQPIIDVEVNLFDEEKINRSDKNMETKTDENGKFSFQGVKPGKYTILVAMRYKSEKDLPCGKEMDRFINDGIGVTSWRDKEDYVQHAKSREFTVLADSKIIKNFDLSCKRRVTRRR